MSKCELNDYLYIRVCVYMCYEGENVRNFSGCDISISVHTPLVLDASSRSSFRGDKIKEIKTGAGSLDGAMAVMLMEYIYTYTLRI